MIYNIVSYVRVLWYKTMLYNIVKSYVLYQYNITLLSPMFYICFCMWCRRRVASGARHRGKESWRCEETIRYQNRWRNRTPARANACSRHRFHCIDLLSLELRGRNIFAPFLLERPSEQTPGRPKLWRIVLNLRCLRAELVCQLLDTAA